MSTSYVHLHRFLLKPFLNNFVVVNSINSFTGRNVFRESFTHVINTFVCPLYPPKTLYHMFFIHICFPHTYQQILTTYPHFVDNIKKSYTRCNYLCVALSKKTYPQICQKDLTSFIHISFLGIILPLFLVSLYLNQRAYHVLKPIYPL